MTWKVDLASLLKGVVVSWLHSVFAANVTVMDFKSGTLVLCLLFYASGEFDHTATLFEVVIIVLNSRFYNGFLSFCQWFFAIVKCFCSASEGARVCSCACICVFIIIQLRFPCMLKFAELLLYLFMCTCLYNLRSLARVRILFTFLFFFKGVFRVVRNCKMSVKRGEPTGLVRRDTAM